MHADVPATAKTDARVAARNSRGGSTCGLARAARRGIRLECLPRMRSMRISGMMRLMGLLTAGLTLALVVKRRMRRIELEGKVVIVTGGGRGLGYAIAQQFAARGCRLAICGRDAATIAAAVRMLRGQGAEIIGSSCDVSDAQAVQTFVRRVVDHYGTVDVLVNNAGQCFVGAATQHQANDFADALQNIFWTQYHPTMAVLPHMREQRSGRIANVTSIGGKVPIPHQSAYSVAKYAATGWSETITTEFTNDGIRVSTITPPPIKNGAALYVHFLGRLEDEFKWFTKTLTSPLTSITADRTARVVMDAVRYGDPERAVSPFSWLAIRAHGLLPNLTLPLLAMGERLLMPKVDAPSQTSPHRMGADVARQSKNSEIRELAQRARADADTYEPRSQLLK